MQARDAVRSLVFGTAGHIDHGKTALVRALTGTDTDRLPEEKARGITIDLGFASLSLPAPPGGEAVRLSLIDVPGHHAFIRNMLAGAGGIEAVLLIVAADDGPKAQTVEHLQICRLLGLQHGLIVVTKTDLVSPERLQAALQEIRDLTASTFLAEAPVYLVAAPQGKGIAELKAGLQTLAAGIPARSEGRVPRLPVDRAFTVRGFGTVITGTLQDGILHAGDAVQVEPGGRVVRMRGVQVHGKARADATAPDRVALNLVGLEVTDLRRGDVLLPQGTLSAVSLLDVCVEMLMGAPPLRHRQQIRVHAFASESLATVLLYDTAAVPFGRETAGVLARLRLTRPMLLVPGDRFVLRQPSPAMTVGGGLVLDAHPTAQLRRPARVAWLQSLQEAYARGDKGAAAQMRVRRRGPAGTTRRQLVAETGWSPAALQVTLAPLLASGVLVDGGDVLIETETLRSVEERLLREVARAPAEGSAGAELRSRLRLPEATYQLALERLRHSRRVQVEGDRLVLAGEAAPRPKPALDARAAAVQSLYQRAGLASPLVNEAAALLKLSPADMRAAVTTLLRSGSLVRLGSDALLVHASALATLKETLQSYRGQPLDVGRFKTLTGLTRKHAIPLLEYLDGARVTRNQGGARTVL